MQIPESKLETTRGKIVEIGNVKIPKTSDFNYEIPLLSYVVIASKDGKYISSCIQLQMDGYGESIDASRCDMIDNVEYYLNTLFNTEECKEHCWQNLLDLFEINEDTAILWNSYHAFQVMLAEQNRTTDPPIYTK